jgi:3-methyladenine DNA glycosylase AlkD
MPAAMHPQLAATMKRLEALGTEPIKKTWQRHGAGENCYGVKFADLVALAKTMRKELPDPASRQALAVALWQTGNADARAYALEIGEPELLDAKGLDSWLDGVRFKMLVDIFASFVGRSPHCMTKLREWTGSRDETLAQAGWILVASWAQYSGTPKAGCRGGWGAAALSAAQEETELLRLLGVIEKNIHSAPNFVKAAMNMALIAVGIRGGVLHAAAVAAAKRIGKVEVDHGDTACKTPDAIPYMEKALARKAGKGGGAKPAKKAAGKKAPAKAAPKKKSRTK